MRTLASVGGFGQKKTWDRAVGLLLKMTFPPENTYFLMFIKSGALECILQYFEPMLTDNRVHVTIPVCLRAWDGLEAVPVPPAKGKFGIFRSPVAQSSRWVHSSE